MTLGSPLGIFDSGVGGLTVLRAIRARLPHLPLRYLGDTARLPYGTKSPNTVVQYALSCTRKLMSAGDLSGLVVACNTASAHAIREINAEVNGRFPVIGVIEPGAEAAVRATTDGVIGIVATEGTIQSGRYTDAILKKNPAAQVVSVTAPLFVPLAEEGFVEGALVQAAMDEHLSPLLEHDLRTLVLGCTHYPLLWDAIDAWFQRNGRNVQIIDSAHSTAAVVEHLQEQSTVSTVGNLDLMVTDSGSRFQRIAERFLGEPVVLHHIDLGS